MVRNNSQITDAKDFAFVENSQLRSINQRLQNDIDQRDKTIAMFKSMSLDEFCLWQKGITPIKGDQK